MTNEEKVDILVSNYYINESDSPEGAQGVRYGAERMAEWKDQQFEWNERMHEQAVNQNLTNKEFREMLEKLPDDALICVECCHPRAMIYDEKYNLIRID